MLFHLSNIAIIAVSSMALTGLQLVLFRKGWVKAGNLSVWFDLGMIVIAPYGFILGAAYLDGVFPEPWSFILAISWLLAVMVLGLIIDEDYLLRFTGAPKRRREPKKERASGRRIRLPRTKRQRAADAVMARRIAGLEYAGGVAPKET